VTIKNVPVSVIIPNYNSGEFLYDCVKSINAGIPPSEIIIVDDVSTDNSISIAKELSETYPNVRLITRTKNGGAVEARHDGIRAAVNEWIAFVDADDFLESGAVSAAYDTAIVMGADICIWQLWRAWGGREWRAISLDQVSFPITGRDAAIMTLGKWGIHPLGVSKKSIYIEAYSGFVENFFLADEVISRLAFMNAHNIVVCNKRYFYTDNPSSSTRTLHPRRLGVLDVQLNLIQICKKLSVAPSTSKKVVRDSIGHAWFLWVNRRAIGTQATKDKVRLVLSQLVRDGDISVWIVLYPKQFIAFLLMSIFVRIPKL
jgi:glycosyltransferase involved in cell wall biosynthesis